jgi:hypothetical protein
MLSIDNRIPPTPATPSIPMAVLGRHAATSTAASLGEFAQASRRACTGAASRRATPLDLVERGARWWTGIADRRVPQWHLPHRTVLSPPFAHVHDFSPPTRPPTSSPRWCCHRRPGTPRTWSTSPPARAIWPSSSTRVSAGSTRWSGAPRPPPPVTSPSPTTSTSSSVRSSTPGPRQPRRRLSGRVAGDHLRRTAPGARAHADPGRRPSTSTPTSR